MATNNIDEFNPADLPLPPPSPGPGVGSGAAPGGISGFTGTLGAGMPQSSVPVVPPAAFFGAQAPGSPVGAPGMPAGLPPATGTPASPLSGQAYAAQLLGSLDARKAITGNEAQNLAAGQSAIGDINAGAADKLAAQQEAQQKAWEQARSTVDARDEELRASIAEAHKAQVDPNRLWNNKSTGSKVLAAIGVALGGFGAGMLHQGTNGAMTILQSAIDADIDSQKANIANNWKSIQEKHGLDNDNFNRSMHDQTWRSNFQTAGLENVKLQLLSAAAKTQSQSVKDNAAIAVKDIEDKQGAIRNGLYQSQMAAQAAGSARYEKLAGEARAAKLKLLEKGDMEPAEADRVIDSQYGMLKGTPYASSGQRTEQLNEVVAQNQARELVLQSNGAIPLDAALKAARAKVNEANPAYAGGKVGGGAKDISFDGVTVKAPTKEAAQKYREESVPFVTTTNLIGELKKIRADNNGGSISADQQVRAKQITTQLIAQIGKMNATGVMNESEVKRMSELIPDPTAWQLPGKDVDYRLDALGLSMNHSQKARFEALSGGEIRAFNPKGQAPKGGIPFTPGVPAGGGGSADPFVKTGQAIPPPVAPAPPPAPLRPQSFRQ